MSRFQPLTVVRPPRKRDTRNTQDEFQCRDCSGTGAIDHPHFNPQHDDWTRCEACNGAGRIRWRAYDPLEILRGLRKFRHPKYQELRARAFAKVRLN